MTQKLRKHGKKLEKTSVGCDIDFTILLSMLKVNHYLKLHVTLSKYCNTVKHKMKTCNSSTNDSVISSISENQRLPIC